MIWQVEATNKVVLYGLNKRVDALESNSRNKLKNFLWAIRTTPKKSSGETPLYLVYGLDAVVPVEIAVSTHRLSHSTMR